MENWNNLNKLLDIDSASKRLKETESQKLVEFCQNGDKSGVRELLKTGAAPNCFADNTTPLIACVESDKFDLAVYLLMAKASIGYKEKIENDDAFWFSLKNKKHDFLSLFVSKRCIMVIDESTKYPALIYATVQSDVKAVEILLGHHRIAVNESDGQGNTALHHNVSKDAPTADDLEIGRLLIAAGADTTARNLDGKSPEEAAVDFSAKSMLLSSRMDKELVEKQDAQPEIPEMDLEAELNDTPVISKTKSNKIKI